MPDNYNATKGVTYTSELSETRRLETARKVARQKVDALRIELVQMEAALNIEKRWDSTVPAYMETIQYMAQRQYQRSLDLLQKLVTQRLFELHRLNTGGIGKILIACLTRFATHHPLRISGEIYDLKGNEIKIEGNPKRYPEV